MNAGFTLCVFTWTVTNRVQAENMTVSLHLDKSFMAHELVPSPVFLT